MNTAVLLDPREYIVIGAERLAAVGLLEVAEPDLEVIVAVDRVVSVQIGAVRVSF
jgi:hypothetical protein